MPVPVLLGLPWLAGVLSSAFGVIVSFFAAYITKRLAIVAAGIVLITAATGVFWAAMQALIAGLMLTFPVEYTMGAALFAPSNLDESVSILVTAKLLRYAYDWKVRLMKYKFFGI